ncbi:MAG TPA: exopolysaccharide biosynthesis protein [Anaerolineales bacterium]|nr:exopolysaccharide biosynthesis protein [Anaerolineales bacterium]HRK89800.1 exopolysaccharide biosynthesis protein [Anaerolineales bacterium]
MNIDLSKNEESELQMESLGEKIETIIEKLPPTEVTLVEIMDIVGADSLLLLTVFLSLVFLVPVSIPGVSTVFGSAILLIGITRLFSRKLWLPEKIGTRKLSAEKLREGFKKALVWFRRLEKVSRPHRMSGLTTEGAMTVFNNLSFILAAVLLMAPFGFIPFSNTLPAVALIFLAIGMMQRDGVSILLGNLSNIATIVYFGFLIAGGGWSIGEFIKLLG